MKTSIFTLIAKIKTGFQRLSDADLVSKALSIISGMTGNINFPTPSPSLDDVGTALADFQLAVTAAANKDREKVVLKKQAKLDLIQLLNSLAGYVTFTANGDATILAGSNFDFYKQRTPVVITQPQNVTVTSGVNSGDLIINSLSVNGAKSYIHQYMADADKANGSWISVNGTAKKCTITGLTPGTLYWCRIAAVGGKGGQVVYSDAVSKFAQ